MGYIVKPFDEKSLYTALEIALFNFSRRQALAQAFHEPESLNEKLVEKLTPRELELLGSIYEGLDNRQLAELYHLSSNAIKTHVKKIFAKLGVSSRPQAIARVRDLLSG